MAITVREHALNQAFAALVDILVSDFEVEALMQKLVAQVTELFSADAAGVLLQDAPRPVQVIAASTESARSLEVYQLQCGQGPGLECLRSGMPVTVPDLDAVSQQWALFVPSAIEHGYAAAHALPLRVRDQTIGALDFFSVTPGEMPADELAAAHALVEVVALGVLQERSSRQRRVVETTQDAMHARYVLEQAKGMLAVSADVGMDEAFDFLRHYAAYREDRFLEVAVALTTGRISASTVIAAGTLGASQDRLY